MAKNATHRSGRTYRKPETEQKGGWQRLAMLRREANEHHEEIVYTVMTRHDPDVAIRDEFNYTLITWKGNGNA
jgi:hypothetical protein